MSIAHYIQQEVLLPRARKQRVLVVYDQDRSYQELCNDLADDDVLVVDASDSSIESREAALSSFVAFDGVARLVEVSTLVRDLQLQDAQQVVAVASRKALVHPRGAAVEQQRHRHRACGSETSLLTLLPEPLQQHVATERDTGRGQRSSGPARAQ